MNKLSPLYLINIGMFVGIGWYFSKLVFVILVTIFTKKKITLATNEELD